MFPTKYRQAINAVLADGEWHARAELVRVVRHTARPEQATRAAAAYVRDMERWGHRTVGVTLSLQDLLCLGYERLCTAALRRLPVQRTGSVGNYHYRLVAPEEARPTLGAREQERERRRREQADGLDRESPGSGGAPEDAQALAPA